MARSRRPSCKRKCSEPIKWVIPDLVCEGLTILAGRPKLGKSWLALDWSIGVASNTKVMNAFEPACHGAVLYLALEDNQRRLLQRRCSTLLGTSNWPAALTVATEWPRLDAGGLDAIREWIDGTTGPRLVIVDTLQKVRPIKANAGYAEDYDALQHLQRLAGEEGIAVVILHHTRKMEADDPLDQVSGTLGLVGSADTTLVLDRSPQKAPRFTAPRPRHRGSRARDPV